MPESTTKYFLNISKNWEKYPLLQIKSLKIRKCTEKYEKIIKGFQKNKNMFPKIGAYIHKKSFQVSRRKRIGCSTLYVKNDT